MAAMRLYSKDELDNALVKLGWQKTESKAQTVEFWKSANGKLLTVPEPDPVSGAYSD